MGNYVNLVTVVNSDERDFSVIIRYFEVLKIDPHLKINEHICTLVIITLLCG